MSVFLTLLSNPTLPLAILGGVLAVVFAVFKVSDGRKTQIALGVHYAFHALQDWDKLEPSAWATTATQALSLIDQYLVGQGYRPLQPDEQAGARVALQGLTGAAAKTVAMAAAAPATVAVSPR